MPPASHHSDTADNLAIDLVSYRQSEVERAQRYALLRQIQTQDGRENFVSSVVAHTILSNECNWGALLSSAPRVLSHMGQCFVVASSPLAASLRLSEGRGLACKPIEYIC